MLYYEIILLEYYNIIGGALACKTKGEQVLRSSAKYFGFWTLFSKLVLVLVFVWFWAAWVEIWFQIWSLMSEMLEMRSFSEPGAIFWEPRAQVLRATSQNPGTSSEKFAEPYILRVKLQSGPQGQTSQNPGEKFSEVGAELLRRPWGVGPFKNSESRPHTPAHHPLHNTFGFSWYLCRWAVEGSLEFLKKRFFRIGPKHLLRTCSPSVLH